MRAKRLRDWVGKTISTKSGVDLEIVDHNGITGNSGRHAFYCKECAKDPELFGNGIFWSRIHSLTNKGATPCGCAFHPKWSEFQYYIRCKRAAISHGLFFYGWMESFRGIYTKLQLHCPVHGEVNKLSINNLVNQAQGCRKCYEDRVSERSLSDDELTEKYVEKCEYESGTTISRIRDKKTGRSSGFYVYCPVCANDEFSNSGLCDGRFETNIESLSCGYKACRCGVTKRKPEAIARYQCESLLEDSGIKFHSWRDGYSNTQSKIIAECPEHGIFYPTPQSVLSGSRCPACSAGGYSVNKAGFVYLLKSLCGRYLKAGITNNPGKRIKDLNRFTPFPFEVLGIKEMQGSAAPILERNLLSMSPRAGFSDFNGASEWIEFDQPVVDAFRAKTPH